MGKRRRANKGKGLDSSRVCPLRRAEATTAPPTHVALAPARLDLRHHIRTPTCLTAAPVEHQDPYPQQHRLSLPVPPSLPNPSLTSPAAHHVLDREYIPETSPRTVLPPRSIRTRAVSSFVPLRGTRPRRRRGSFASAFPCPCTNDALAIDSPSSSSRLQQAPNRFSSFLNPPGSYAYLFSARASARTLIPVIRTHDHDTSMRPSRATLYYTVVDPWYRISMLDTHSPLLARGSNIGYGYPLICPFSGSLKVSLDQRTLLRLPPFSLPRLTSVFRHDRLGASSSMPTLNPTPNVLCAGGLEGQRRGFYSLRAGLEQEGGSAQIAKLRL
ncbi:hypothetical protein B0H14DRAFT_3902572 [Mycena olivaceomarginata]|nr:hypothetical protein B0H14DRAFT_3902572 [Mycena olivaceomarginata]